jgi:glycosyl transferase, family 25
MHIFVISLADPPDRRNSALSKLKPLGLPFEIVDGVEAKKWQRQELPIELGRNDWLKAGEVGCYLAHLRALRRIVDYDLPYACILEDDFCFEANPDVGLAELESTLPADFHYIHLQRDIGLNGSYYVAEDYGLYRRTMGTPLGAVGYVVTRPLADYILNKHQTPQMPIDWLFDKLAKQGRFYMPRKPIVGVQEGLPSEIHGAHTSAKKNLLIDCGTHHWQGYQQLRNTFAIDEHWDVYSFEANPETYSSALSCTPEGVELIHAVVLDRDGAALFHPMKDQNQASNALSHRVPDYASEYLEPVEVQGIDLARFSEQQANLRRHWGKRVLKLDIEGSEYRVLLRLMATGTLAEFTDVIVEYHSRFFSGAALELCEQIEACVDEYCRRNKIRSSRWH